MQLRAALVAVALVACHEASPPSAPLVASDDPALPKASAEPPDAALDGDDGAPIDPAAAEAAILKGIRDLAPNERAMTDHARTLFVEHRDILLKTLRVVPDQGKGTIRIYGIQAGSILARLGLQNGDSLVRILGQPVNTPDAVEQAWSLMSRAQKIDVEVERRGQPVQIVIFVE